MAVAREMGGGELTAMRPWPGLRRLAALAVLALAAGLYGYLAWASTRGFNLTDEGYYLLASQHPADVLAWANAGHVYTAVLYRLGGGDVIALRRAGLVLLALGAHVLAGGIGAQLDRASPAAPRDRAERALGWAFLQVGTLFYYNLRLMSPSFNLVNAVGLNLATGWLLGGLASWDGARAAGRAFAAAGAALGLSFFCKFSSGVGGLVLATALLACWPATSPAARRRAVGALLGGFAAWVGLHFAVLQGPAAWWSMERAGIAWLQAAAPWVGTTTALEGYAVGAWRILTSTTDVFARYLVAAPLAVAAVAFAVRRRMAPAWSRSVVLAGAVGALAAVSYAGAYHWRGGYWGNRSITCYLGWMLVLAATTAASRLGAAPALGWPRVTVVALVLAAVPLLGVVGTADEIEIVLPWYLTPWFGCLLVLLHALSRAHDDVVVVPLAVAVIAALTGSQIVARTTQPLWHNSSSVFAQTVSTPVGEPATTLGLAPILSRLVNDVRDAAAACGFEPGDEVLALYNLPGLVYAIGGRSPALPWFLHRPSFRFGDAGTRRATEEVLALVPHGRLAHAFILTDARETSRFPKLEHFGLRFPDDYQRCNEAPFVLGRQRIELWRPVRPEPGPYQLGTSDP